MILKAVDARDIDFTPYGRLFNMCEAGEGLHYTDTPDYSDACTAQPVIDTLASLGCTKSCGVPFTAKEMERHFHTQEAQMPTDQPIVFLVAPATEGPRPHARDVRAVIIPKGYVVVLERGVWHSASHGLYSEGRYYWMANVYRGEPTEWQPIEDGPITVEAPEK